MAPIGHAKATWVPSETASAIASVTTSREANMSVSVEDPQAGPARILAGSGATYNTLLL
jgi:hypothetical protein